MLDPDECCRMVPPLGRNRLVGGSFCPRTAAPRRSSGSTRYCGPPAVTALSSLRHARLVARAEWQRFSRAHRAGAIAAGKVLLCTDWAVPDLVAPFGIDIPVVPLPKEILVTAPAPQMVKPILVSLEHRIAVNQVGRS